MNRHRGRVLVVLAVVALSVACGFATTAAGAPGPDTVPQQATPTDNNTTVQHERPDQVSEAGDSGQVSLWLAQQLQSRLEGSAVNLSQGEYEAARELVGDEYNSRLGQYVDVAGDTRSSYDDDATERFNETRSEQEEFANTTQSYEETYDTYQEAQQQGNSTRAREAARELETLSERLLTLNESLQGNYVRLTNRTGVSTATTSTAIAETTTEIATTQATVRDETLVETNLTVQTNGTSVAFDEPLAVTGRIRTANGTALDDESVGVIVGNRTYQTRTDADGRFEVTYRPVGLPVDASNVSVRYRPGQSTPYLGAATTTPVEVSQVTPTLAVTNSTETVAYDETTITRVDASVDGRPVPALPLELSVGSVGTRNTTTATGQTTLSGRLPASVPAGNRTIAVDHDRTGRAIAPAETTVPVTVTQTATNLTVSATAGNGTVAVRGRLRTSQGATVDGQQLTVTVAETNRTVTTNATGWYQLRATNLSAAAGPNVSVVPVTAQFTGTGTNLDASRAETTVTIARSSSPPPSDAGLPWAWILVGVVGAVTVAGVLAVSRYTGTDPEQTAPSDPEPSPATEPTPSPAAGFLTDAQAALDAGQYERATVAAYASARSRLTADHDLSTELTHREFLAAVTSQGGPLPEFETIASAYERVTFQGIADAETAEEALAAATTLSDSEATTT